MLFGARDARNAKAAVRGTIISLRSPHGKGSEVCLSRSPDAADVQFLSAVFLI